MKKPYYDIDFVKDLVKKQNIKIETIFYIGSGNHSDAFLTNNKLVIKLPKHKKASDCLIQEMKVLKGLERKLALSIPNVEFDGTFTYNDNNFVFFVSKRLFGRNLSKKEFLSLSNMKLEENAKIIANFLFELHSQKQIIDIRRKDLCLLHGDFSLNHCLFDENNLVCSILDFGDARVGKFMSDFCYLLDDEDDEEFGVEFGNLVLNNYLKLQKEKANEHNI